MVRVLMTGFEPFDGASANPSWEAARLVAEEPPPGTEVSPLLLPCVFGDCLRVLYDAVERTAPDLVLCTGQAAGRSGLTVERIAVNVDDARLPDNAGRQPVDRPVVPGGPAAYFATLPVKACTAAARAAGVPCSVSQTAGTFVCNHLFYGLMHLLSTRYPDVRGGFVHVPSLPEQVLDGAGPAMPAETAARGLRAVLTAAATVREDIRLAAGAVH
ncbi:pyroglutamyl-peptidase I [Streptacidiphilus sp. ASG 303]|uniref:pyroglutamyl-peptidase I n=1 Tax=Streptacidiphilus sp. ASG 303 TaxID=2896847 RepID=UPI001E593C3B|nr:pyroglutamyl-peptidase I [Streptacidiphilus sp. ASG 303]MCD0483600.1 pyroglutamyl-peptidase I [Streptacidiphilus sp. ASG 303]